MPGSDVVGGLPSWHMASIAAFLRSLDGGDPFSPSLEQGVAVQRVLEMAVRSAALEGRRLRWSE